MTRSWHNPREESIGFNRTASNLHAGMSGSNLGRATDNSDLDGDRKIPRLWGSAQPLLSSVDYSLPASLNKQQMNNTKIKGKLMKQEDLIQGFVRIHHTEQRPL
jgi:hypothetical protein